MVNNIQAKFILIIDIKRQCERRHREHRRNGKHRIWIDGCFRGGQPLALDC